MSRLKCLCSQSLGTPNHLALLISDRHVSSLQHGNISATWVREKMVGVYSCIRSGPAVDITLAGIYSQTGDTLYLSGGPTEQFLPQYQWIRTAGSHVLADDSSKDQWVRTTDAAARGYKLH